MSSTPSSGGRGKPRTASGGARHTAASGGGSARPKPTHVERVLFPKSDRRSGYNFDPRAAHRDIARKQTLTSSVLAEEEAQRPFMHAAICTKIMDLLQVRFSVETVENIYCKHADIASLSDHLSSVHSRDPHWQPAKWNASPLRPYILVAQSIYDDTSVMSFPKKLSTVLLARLATDDIAITAFVDGLFPPSLSSVVPTAEAAPTGALAADIAAGGGAAPPEQPAPEFSPEFSPPEGFSPEQPPTPIFPTCVTCGLILNLNYVCEPCSNYQAWSLMLYALRDDAYASACEQTIVRFIDTYNPANPWHM